MAFGMPPTQSRTVTGPQGTLAVHRRSPSADAPSSRRTAPLPVLFLHCDSGRASQWWAVIDRLPADLDAIAFDFRGHGDSAPAADGDYSYHGRAADADAVAKALGLERFLLVAHSGGAGVALQYAADHPRRVAGMLLVDPASDPRAMPADVRNGVVRDLAGPNALEVQRAFYASLVGANVAVRDQVLADLETVAPAARAGVGEALANWDPEPTLRVYRGPALILASPQTDAQRTLYALRPDLSHRVIPDVGHWIQLERPDEVARAVDALAHASAAPSLAQ